MIKKSTNSFSKESNSNINNDISNFQINFSGLSSELDINNNTNKSNSVISKNNNYNINSQNINNEEELEKFFEEIKKVKK